MFSETRYALNGDLRVAYRASREGPRDIVYVPNWFTCCEHLPELPSVRGWVEAMTSLGRLIFFDHPGTGASDPITPGAQPTLEQWADSITAVLDDLGSSEAVLLAFDGAFAPAALFAATHPSRTTALVVLEDWFTHDHQLTMSPVDGTLKQMRGHKFDFEGTTYNREPHLKLDDSTCPSEVGRIYFARDFDNLRFIVDHVGLKLYGLK